MESERATERRIHSEHARAVCCSLYQIVRHRHIPWGIMILSTMHSIAQLASMMTEYLWVSVRHRQLAVPMAAPTANSSSDRTDDDFLSVSKSELCDKHFPSEMCYRFSDFSPYHSNGDDDENIAHTNTECYKLLENTFLLLVWKQPSQAINEQSTCSTSFGDNRFQSINHSQQIYLHGKFKVFFIRSSTPFNSNFQFILAICHFGILTKKKRRKKRICLLSNKRFLPQSTSDPDDIVRSHKKTTLQIVWRTLFSLKKIRIRTSNETNNLQQKLSTRKTITVRRNRMNILTKKKKKYFF